MEEKLYEESFADKIRKNKITNTLGSNVYKIAGRLYNLIPRSATMISFLAIKKKGLWIQNLSMYTTRDVSHEKPIPEAQFPTKMNLTKAQLKEFHEYARAVLEYTERQVPPETFNYLVINVTYDGYLQWRAGMTSSKNSAGFSTDPIINVDHSPISKYDIGLSDNMSNFGMIN